MRDVIPTGPTTGLSNPDGNTFNPTPILYAGGWGSPTVEVVPGTTNAGAGSYVVTWLVASAVAA